LVMSQDFGTDFKFSADRDALHSILTHKGVSYAQTIGVSKENRPSMTPAKNIPDNFKKTDKLEFFESKAGQIFFRRKIVGNKDHTPGINPFSSKKNGFGRSFRDLEGDYGVPKRMNFSTTKAGKLRTPFSNKDENSKVVKQTALSDKKPSLFIPPIHRQSISERKAAPPKCGLPLPKSSTQSQARKTLFNKPKLVPDKLKPKLDKLKPNSEDEHQFTRPSNILPPLTKLTRESFRQIPRESLAWMSQLPRESATFAELEKLMTDADKKFVNDDDTDSFEAMEKRMRTPSKQKLVGSVPRLGNKENISNVKLEPSSDVITDFPSELVVEHREPQQSLTYEQPKVDRKKCVMYGNTLANGCSLTNLSPLDVATSAPTTPVKTSAQTSPLHNSAPNTPTFCKPSISNLLGTPLTPGIKSLSTADLPSSGLVQMQVFKSASVADLDQVVSMSDLVPTEQVVGVLESLNDYQEQLEKFRKEQDELAKQEEEIMKKIKERKKQFREMWGVSPLRINTKRTVLPPRSYRLAELDNLKDIEVSPMTESRKSPVMTPHIFKNMDSAPETARKVRFNSGNNETRNLTPNCTSEFSPLCSPLGSLNNSTVDTRSSSSNQSLASLKSSFSFLQTPLPPKKRFAQNFDNEDKLEVANPQHLVEPTPVALKKLSDRVKAEFAALYADSSDDTDSEEPEARQAKLSF